MCSVIRFSNSFVINLFCCILRSFKCLKIFVQENLNDIFPFCLRSCCCVFVLDLGLMIQDTGLKIQCVIKQKKKTGTFLCLQQRSITPCKTCAKTNSFCHFGRRSDVHGWAYPVVSNHFNKILYFLGSIAFPCPFQMDLTLQKFPHQL